MVGASNIVGKPMAIMLQNRGATVTLCNKQNEGSCFSHEARGYFNCGGGERRPYFG